MAPVNMTMKAVYYQSRGRWIAQSIEFDFAVLANTLMQAERDLSLLIAARVARGVQNGRAPAPEVAAGHGRPVALVTGVAEPGS